MIKMIPCVCVEASDMPKDVLEYCMEYDISTHYQNDLAQIENNDNPFANWLRENGYEFKESVTTVWDFNYIGIIAT